MSISSSSSSAFSSSPDHHSSDQLCYVHCNFCDTVLAVSVPCNSLLKSTLVTVRCGHCTNILSVNMSSLFFPPPPQPPPPPPQLQHNFLSPQNLMEQICNSPANLLINEPNYPNHESLMPVRRVEEIPKPAVINRPPEKRQRVPSAYNRFIKDEIRRIKAGNPEISHREAFSTAAKNWAHFPHIEFGLMRETNQPVKKSSMHQQQEGEQVTKKDGFYVPSNVGVFPY